MTCRARLALLLSAAALGCGNGATYIPVVLEASNQPNFGTVVTAGAPTVFLTGLFFSPGMTVTWNGRPVPVTVAGGTQAQIQLDPAVDDPVAGTATVVASSGGEAGAPLQVSVVDATLAVNGVSPQEIDPGSPDTKLSVSGNGFTAGTQVLWNGVALQTTLVAGTLLQAQVPSSFLAAAGEGILQVTIAGCSANLTTCQVSGPTVLVGASSEIVMPGPFGDIVADATHGKLYLVGTGAIQPLDLASGTFGVPAAATTPVSQIFISDQDRYLYGFAPFQSGLRVTLPDLTNAQGTEQGQAVTALAPVPGAPASFAFSTNGFLGVTDGDTTRPNVSPVFSATSLAFGADASTLYALSAAVFIVRLNASGVSSMTRLTVNSLNGSSIAYDPTTSLIYSNRGEVFDQTGAVHPLSSIVSANPACSDALLDGAGGRMFFVCAEPGLGLTVRSFDVATGQPLARIRLPQLLSPGVGGTIGSLAGFKMVRFGANGLAVIEPSFFAQSTSALVLYTGPFVH
jgi:hypothetical protein